MRQTQKLKIVAILQLAKGLDEGERDSGIRPAQG